MVLGRFWKVKGPTFGPLAVCSGVVVAPVSEMMEYSIFEIVSGLSPLFTKVADSVTPPSCSPTITPLKDSTFGLMARSGATEVPTPFNETGVLVE